MKHISIRVPWHDNKWNGCICSCPTNNPFCMILKNISTAKNCEKEESMAGQEWCKLPVEDLPPCKGENGAFMNERAYKRQFIHVYQNNQFDIPQKKLLPTIVTVPEYSFFGVPYRYLSKDNAEYLNERFPNFAEEENAPFNTAWTFGRQRQYDILNWFQSNIKPGESLVTFYCKSGNPIDEDSKRIVIGLGEVTNVNPILEYNSKQSYTYPFWEILMSHSIRMDLKKSKGFLIPYHDYLKLDETVIKKKTGLTKNQAIQEIKLTLDKLGNSEKIFNELSYGCEYVSDHSMLIILNAARNCIENVKKHGLIGGDWDSQLRWINNKVAQVKSLIGPFPGFAEALRSLGFNYAYLIEQDLRTSCKCSIKDNPWIYLDKLISGKLKVQNAIYNSELPAYKKTWDSTTSDTKEILELLSRFEIGADTMGEWLKDEDSYEDLIDNPYILSESYAFGDEGIVTPEMIDLGVIADPEIQGEYVPPMPSRIDTKIDERRIRAYVIQKLLLQSYNGDTLLSINEISDYIKEELNTEGIEFPVNYFHTYKDFMSERLYYINDTALQLDEFNEMETYLATVFKARANKDVKFPLHEDWSAKVKSVEGYDPNDKRSINAAETQIRALEMFSLKKLCVLTGAAGTGKTSVIEALLRSKQMQDEGVLLLAPTGKARVKLGKQSKTGEALTIAQFLTRQGFFNWNNMIPEDNEKGRKYSGCKNIIIDECSMLTTREFYVLFKALELSEINRIILIGDPYQLPPIGEGRTFSDLCNYLKKEIPDAITSLTVVVRTIHSGDSDILTLASWFSGVKPDKSADEIFDKIQQNNLHKDLTVYTWKDETELKDKLVEVLNKELEYPNLPLRERILKSIGMDSMQSAYYNPDVVESFQVLTPVKNPVWGSYQLNNNFQEFCKGTNSQFNALIGTTSIATGDKVIQLKNIKLEAFPSREKKQLSNGQIGFAKFVKSGKVDVCFSGYPQETFTITSENGEDKEQKIDLAYAITIHKSQGSDFGTVLVVLPKSGIILSRELIYTALTRAKKRLILLVEDNMQWLMEYTKPQQSILARRNSNLFGYSVREEKISVPYVEGLIHRTLSGTIVRSKSEVIIADALFKEHINFEYEKLKEENGHHCIPDFTFETPSGDSIIWEHLGMLDNPSYKASWEKKLSFYNSIGFEEGVNLFTTRDHNGGRIDSNEIQEMVEKIKSLVLIQKQSVHKHKVIRRN